MTRDANPLRGEALFEIGGKAMLLRPTFQNLVAAEEELGSLFSLVERASAGTLTVSEIAAIIWHCLPEDERPPRELVGHAVVRTGLVNAARPLRIIFAQVLQGEP